MLNFRVSKSLIIPLLLTLGACQDPAPETVEKPSVNTPSQEVVHPVLTYPETAMGEQVDDYHGTEVKDPYRWLEDDVRESAEVAEWVDAQNAVTNGYLESIPERAQIAERLKVLWDYEKIGLPEKQGGRYFFGYNDGLLNQDLVYVQSSLDAEPELLIDPNGWSEDGTVALAGYTPSPDGRWVALSIQDGGSDWRQARVLDLDTREQLEDELSWLKFTGISWHPSGDGFYYSRYPEPNEDEKFQSLNVNQSVYYHEVGTEQSTDRLVYARPDEPTWGLNSDVTEDGAYLVITIWHGTDARYQIAYQDLKAGTEPKMLIEGFDYDYSLIGNLGSELIFKTTDNAPKGRILGIDLDNPSPEAWREIVSERENVLRAASHVGGHLVARYLKDARSEIKVYATDGTEVRDVALPGIGSAGGFGGKVDDSETFYSYSSFNSPSTIYRYDVESGESTVFKQAKVDFDPNDYQVDQVFFESKDGTRVPMFISYLKGMEKDKDRPTLLYGYGGFNIPMQPGFSISRLAWMEMGGVYAVANIRGGGEYGEEWHKAGTKLQKQNVFDDFIAAGEFLVNDGWTQPSRLAVFGGSNGGLLVGAVVNQRPDLFAAGLPAVGVMDMLRFHRFTAGRFWVDDYGSADNPDEFEALYAYSPYHNVAIGAEYPAVMVTTADTDDRVVPGHSFKYAAALQAAQTGSAPVLIRIETRAGHGSGKPTDKVIEEYSDRWGFLLANLGMTLPEGYGGSE